MVDKLASSSEVTPDLFSSFSVQYSFLVSPIPHNIRGSITMLRNGATRFARSITAPAARPFAPAPRAAPAHQWATQFGSLASKRPRTSQLARITPIKTTVSRRNVTKEQKKAEDRYAHEKLEPTPETVSTTSSIHPFLSEHATPNPENDVDMMKGVKSDIVCQTNWSCLEVTDLSRKLFVKHSVCGRSPKRHTTWVLQAQFLILVLRLLPCYAHMRSTTLLQDKA